MTDHTHRPSPPERGAVLTLSVDKLAFGGQGVARADGFVVFVDRGLPGQTVQARITRVEKRHAEAEVVSVLTPSPHQTEAPCPHFGICGGCQWQDLAYAEQLRWKRIHVEESLARLAGMQDMAVEETLPSPDTFHYRNKIELDFSGGVLSGMAAGAPMDLGFHRRNGSAIVNVETCLLQSPLSARIVNATRQWCAGSGAPACDPRSGNGFWRRLALRRSAATGEVLAQIITSPIRRYGPLAAALAEHLLEMFAPGPDGEGLVGVVHSVRRSSESVPAEDLVVQTFGRDTLEERLGGLRFTIQAGAFFQPNTRAAELLYEVVREFAGLTGAETVWDLYCGSGGISLFLASRALCVTGFDIGRESIRNAKANAADNQLNNCRFVAGDILALLRKEKHGPDVVVTDPPRAGLHPQAVSELLRLAPQRMVYVSCNPPTQARDLAPLLTAYRLEKAQPVDLFPHTPHIECVTLLTRRA